MFTKNEITANDMDSEKVIFCASKNYISIPEISKLFP